MTNLCLSWVVELYLMCSCCQTQKWTPSCENTLFTVSQQVISDSVRQQEQIYTHGRKARPHKQLKELHQSPQRQTGIFCPQWDMFAVTFVRAACSHHNKEESQLTVTQTTTERSHSFRQMEERAHWLNPLLCMITRHVHYEVIMDTVETVQPHINSW